MISRKHLCQTESQNLHFAIRCHLDIGRLEVAVNDAFLMRGFESLGDLQCELQGSFNGNGTGLNPVSQRLAFHQFKDKEARKWRQCSDD